MSAGEVEGYVNLPECSSLQGSEAQRHTHMLCEGRKKNLHTTQDWSVSEQKRTEPRLVSPTIKFTQTQSLAILTRHVGHRSVSDWTLSHPVR